MSLELITPLNGSSVNNQTLLNTFRESIKNNEKINQLVEYAKNFFSNNSDNFKTGLMFVGLGRMERFLNRELMGGVMCMNGWNFDPQLPQFIRTYGETIHSIFDKVRLPLLSPVTISITSELLFRVILQEGLLKRVPEKILNKIAPEHASSINGTPAKVARITLSALAWSLAFAHGNSSHILINAFARGIFLGAVQEQTGNPLLTIACRFGGVLL